MGLRIMVVGGGAREHALLWKLAQSGRTASLLCDPGNAGTDKLAQTLAIPVNDHDALVAAALAERVDLVVVGPEEPLAGGLADRLRERGVATFGPSAAASRIESSKSWAKEVMTAAGVPTARSVVVTDLVEGFAALAQFEAPIVIKADGLAAGKGVVVAASKGEARMAMTAFLEDGALGTAGKKVVIEECLVGLEVSIFGITDGTTVRTLAPACDYKRVGEGDVGPNTGGMGAYAPTTMVSEEQLQEYARTILEPTVREMARRGAPMQGLLYAGLMLTDNGPKVLEFNARFGDPETQVVLPLLESDLVDLLHAAAHGRLGQIEPPRMGGGSAVGIVLASGGYPGPFLSGHPIAGLDDVPEDVIVFHAGTRHNSSGALVTAGGRVMTVVGRGPTVAEARERALGGAERITFEDKQYRQDIGIGLREAGA